MLPLTLPWWLGSDLNQRPPGYEPDQLQPLMFSLNKMTFCYACDESQVPSQKLLNPPIKPQASSNFTDLANGIIRIRIYALLAAGSASNYGRRARRND
jgi:hypothetical protein